MRGSDRLVLDASVVVKWFSGRPEKSMKQALELRARILEGACSVTVPDLLLYELANVLRYHPGLAPGDVMRSVGSLFGMGFRMLPAKVEVTHRAVELAFRHHVTVYDAVYLAVAEIEGCLLVTADLKFHKRVQEHDHVVRLDEVGRRDLH